jgi:hypothetical protein
VIDELVSRLREADRGSVQRALGSRIFGEAADALEAMKDALVEAEQALDAAVRIINLGGEGDALDHLQVPRGKIAIRQTLAKIDATLNQGVPGDMNQ